MRARGLVAGLFQVGVFFRVVVRVVNCAWVSGGCTLVVQRSFLVVLRLFVMFYPQFLPWVGLLFSGWWVPGFYPL